MWYSFVAIVALPVFTGHSTHKFSKDPGIRRQWARAVSLSTCSTRSYHRLQVRFGGVCRCSVGWPILFGLNKLRPTVFGCQATNSIPPQVSCVVQFCGNSCFTSVYRPQRSQVSKGPCYTKAVGPGSQPLKVISPTAS